MNKDRLNRRDFLKAGGLLGLGLSSALLFPFPARAAAEESVRFSRQLMKTTRVDLLMGTFISMTALYPSRDKGQDALGRAMEEMRRLSAMMTRFDAGSRLSHLNACGSLHDVPPELREVLSRSVGYATLTDGAFDVTIKPLVDVFKNRADRGQPIDLNDPEVVRALELVDVSALKISETGVCMGREGMGVTLDGIAKGYIVDKAAETLLSCGVENFLINAGGDIRVNGRPSSGNQWSVAIEDPQKKRGYPEVIHLSGGGVATSGGYEVYFDREKIHHHLVNPRTGNSPHLAASVSVVAPTVMQADALSTSVFVMPVKNGLALIDSLPGHACLLVSHSGRTVASKNWPARL